MKKLMLAAALALAALSPAAAQRAAAPAFPTEWQDNDKWCSIDRMLPDLRLPAVFKVDVDGGAMDVFRGAEQTLRKDGCMILLETHTADLERECDAFLKGLGYKTRIIKPGWYRSFLPEGRIIEHNQWMVASRG